MYKRQELGIWHAEKYKHTIWHGRTIIDILKNATYTGTLVYGKMPKSLYQGIKCHRAKPDEWRCIPEDVYKRQDTNADSTEGGAAEDSTEVSVDVSLPVTWTEDGKVICYVTFELNDAEILLHRPVETWHSGKHILSLYYPIENVVPNITNTFNVYLRMENGSGTGGIGCLLYTSRCV